MTTANTEFRVMTSGAFTAAYKTLIPQLERLTGRTVVTVTTSIGTGDTSIPSRLQRGEVADIVIVADGVLRRFIADGLVLAEGATVIARSMMGFAVRAGAPDPQIRTADDLKRALLAAKGIGYSASESGKYYTTEIVQHLGIADQVLPKSRLVGGGERVGAVIARGELDFGFQQISELLPVPGIAHITPLPPELQKTSSFTAGIGANSPDRDAARRVIAFLASPEARQAITDSGLEPAAG
ncbi:MAG: substrate-binding domain-containing protein [Burkholderiales bacterium]|nr:substrate-binding domain-containing protein [Burkholderiales bacterium]